MRLLSKAYEFFYPSESSEIATTSSFRDSEFFAEVRQRLQRSDISDEQKLGLIAATRETCKQLFDKD